MPFSGSWMNMRGAPKKKSRPRPLRSHELENLGGVKNMRRELPSNNAVLNTAKRTIFFVALCALVGLGIACSPESAKAKEGKDGEDASGPEWNWEIYPPLTRMRVAQLPCQLQPKSTITVVSPISGLLRIYA